jgi:hypothetical protein
MHRGEECMNRHSPAQALFAEPSPGSKHTRLAAKWIENTVLVS